MNHQGTLRIKGSKEFRHHDAIENGTWNEKLRLILPVKKPGTIGSYLMMHAKKERGPSSNQGTKGSKQICHSDPRNFGPDQLHPQRGPKINPTNHTQNVDPHFAPGGCNFRPHATTCHKWKHFSIRLIKCQTECSKIIWLEAHCSSPES